MLSTFFRLMHIVYSNYSFKSWCAFSLNLMMFTILLSAVDIALGPEEQILNCNQPDIDDGLGCENDDEEAVAMMEESPSGIGLT